MSNTATSEKSASHAEAEAKRKLDAWLAKMEPIDYDAPGTSVREQ